MVAKLWPKMTRRPIVKFHKQLKIDKVKPQEIQATRIPTRKCTYLVW